MFEKPKIQEKDQGQDRSKFLYQGSSMHPTFRPGQMLFIQSQASNLVSGDVVIFYDADKRTNVVHRIVRIEDGLITTRGDNNLNIDSRPIAIQDIIGKVIRVEGFGQDKSVRGGKPGLFKMNVWIFRRKVIQFIENKFFPLYSWIKSTGLVKKVWHPEIKQIILNTQYGTVIKYTHKKRVIAIWGPAEQFQRLRHPYDLVIEPPPSNRASENLESNELTA